MNGPVSAGGRVESDKEVSPFPKKEKYSISIPYQAVETPDIVTKESFF
jgi:hypothetical protein